MPGAEKPIGLGEGLRMSEIAPLIIGSEKLTSIFGGWPSFHDAKVHELHFQRGHIDTEAKVYEFPLLTIKLHLWLMTNDVDQKGYFPIYPPSAVSPR
jgi:hypothetical protein